jgi:hypothetical protein
MPPDEVHIDFSTAEKEYKLKITERRRIKYKIYLTSKIPDTGYRQVWRI